MFKYSFVEALENVLVNAKRDLKVWFEFTL